MIGILGPPHGRRPWQRGRIQVTLVQCRSGGSQDCVGELRGGHTAKW